MSVTVIVLLLLALIGLNFIRLPMLVWLFLWPLAAYLFLRYGITTWVPASVLNIYLGLTVLAVVTYVFTSPKQYKEVTGQLTTFITDERYKTSLWSLVVVLPCLFAFQTYRSLNVDIMAPTFGRTIHPNPPTEVSFKGKSIDLVRGKNPYRELEKSDPEKFKTHLANGKRVYIQNCVFCHGDDLRGDGMFAHGFDPVPANLNSATTIAMLQEGYLFWRIAKGGPGLPDESAPWSSSMPAWEKFLSEDEIWDVILYLYEHTGLKPREQEEHH